MQTLEIEVMKCAGIAFIGQRILWLSTFSAAPPGYIPVRIERRCALNDQALFRAPTE